MQRLNILDTHPAVLEAWEYGTVKGGSRCTVLNHPDGYALLTLDDLCALRFLQDLRKGSTDLTRGDPPYPLVESVLPGAIAYANGSHDDVYVCKEPVMPMEPSQRRAVMQAARTVFSSIAQPPASKETEQLVATFGEELVQRVPAWATDNKPVARLMHGVQHALQWWQGNLEHAPQESFVFGRALTQCAWQTPRGVVLLPHVFCKD